MPKPRKWIESDLNDAVRNSRSLREVLIKLGLKPAGGNYSFIGSHIRRLGLDTTHFKGKSWSKGLSLGYKFKTDIDILLTENSSFQSYKLKRRLFIEGLKQPICELCGWAESAVDGRIPIELDHVNGDKTDNRLINLRILCPNCHSLQPTHRGKNIGRYARVV